MKQRHKSKLLALGNLSSCQEIRHIGKSFQNNGENNAMRVKDGALRRERLTSRMEDTGKAFCGGGITRFESWK